ADAQLRPRPRLLQDGHRCARWSHLGPERRRARELVPLHDADQAAATRRSRSRLPRRLSASRSMHVYLRTFGCRANHYDSQTARAMIERAGHGIVSDVREADVAVFNSCAVTAEAEADLRAAVRRAARSQPRLRSVIMGCATGFAAQRD